MSKLINLTIDDKNITVPEGTLIIDAAKQAGIVIPVFCYHPKLKPVGMCRMCLVTIGRPAIDRATGKPVLQPDGKPQIQFNPKLEISCATPVAEGMHVVTTSEEVKAARKAMLEFLLTSHPLDCPICDKGGECPLQNLTLAYGPGQSRFLFDEKLRLAKQLPLGELIYLDRERCIQCGRCVRFQSEIVDDPVIGFHNRGRGFEIISYSDPGFDSYFSGNTTDICPVGALTTTDFRFGARPWELNAAASICPHCPVGCNLTINVRREVVSGGKTVIKRVMPRQNQGVNEIWICDKGRFAYHYVESRERLDTPLIRKNGELTPATWDEALDLVAERFRSAGEDLLVLAGGRLPNEDLFNLRRLADGVRGTAVLHSSIAGGELTTQYGTSTGIDFGQMGKGSVILVVASNLHEEAPIWYLRVKQAAERGATLIVANGRPTRLDRYAAHILRYQYGDEAETIANLKPGSHPTNPELSTASEVFSSAGQAVVVFGSDGLGLAGSQALARACADLLSSHSGSDEEAQPAEATGKAKNALIGVWPHANDQGAWELGFHAKEAATYAQKPVKALYIVAADLCGDDPEMVDILAAGKPFIVVQELFLSATAQHADVLLPAQAFTERDGTFTSGERRVQRFYPAVPARPGCRPDYVITAEIGKRMGLDIEGRSPVAVFAQISAEIPAFKDLNYRKLAQTVPQWPVMGTGLERKGLYFSGTEYANRQGLGLHLSLPTTPVPYLLSPVFEKEKGIREKGDGLLAVPVTCLYDRGQTVWNSELLRSRGGNRIGKPWVALNPEDAARLGIQQGQPIRVSFDNSGYEFPEEIIATLDEGVPAGIVLAPRSFGLPVQAPAAVSITAVPAQVEMV
jgi:NADH-quinone oxidoreductase subunit G